MSTIYPFSHPYIQNSDSWPWPQLKWSISGFMNFQVGLILCSWRFPLWTHRYVNLLSLYSDLYKLKPCHWWIFECVHHEIYQQRTNWYWKRKIKSNKNVNKYPSCIVINSSNSIIRIYLFNYPPRSALWQRNLQFRQFQCDKVNRCGAVSFSTLIVWYFWQDWVLISTDDLTLFAIQLTLSRESTSYDCLFRWEPNLR